MRLGGFFKKIFGGILRALPYIRRALKHPSVRSVLATKISPKLIKFIFSLIDLAEKMDQPSSYKHEWVVNRATPEAVKAGMKRSELDVLIHMGVSERKGRAKIVSVA